MRVRLFSTLAAVALATVGSAHALPAASVPSDVGVPNPEVVPGEVVVGFKSGVPASKQKSILQGLGATTRLKLTPIRARVAKVAPAKTGSTLLALRRNPSVRYAEPNFVVRASDLGAGTPNDPSFDSLWGLWNHGQTVNGVTGVGGDDSNVRPAWSQATGKGIVVAVIDTGIDFTHPDLAGATWVNPGEDCTGCRTNGTDDDGDGYVDDWRGWDFYNHDNDPTDDQGHGTHVAGTIAARADNGAGVVGVAPGVKIMPLKVLGANGAGSVADAAEAILYAGAHGARILNNSWGAHYFSTAMNDAVTALTGAVGQSPAKAALLVAAAGNGSNGYGWPDYNWMGVLTAPAAIESPNIISVAAYDSGNHLTRWSNWGEHLVDIAAPGTNILSTWPGGTYTFHDGTSMAAPHVSGVAALLMERFPAMSAEQIKTLLLNDVHFLPPTEFTNSDYGYTWTESTKSHGALDAGYAITCRGPALKLWIDQPAKDFHAIVTKPTPITVLAETCPPGDPYAVSATMNGSPITLADRGDGVYTGAFTPLAAGPVTIVATESAGATSQKHTVVGRADWQYGLSDDRYQWIDAPSAGKDTGLRSALDFTTIPLPFPFTFYGQTFNTTTISGKGWITFGLPLGASVPTQDPDPIFPFGFPTLWPPNGMIAPFWDGLLSIRRSGAVWYRTVGSPPSRRFVIAWDRGNGRLLPGTARFGGVSLGTCPGQGDFELILDETTNLIRFEYQHVSFGCSDYGGNAVIGIENFTGDVGTQFSRFGIAADHSTGNPVLKPYEQKKGLLFAPQLPTTSGGRH